MGFLNDDFWKNTLSDLKRQVTSIDFLEHIIPAYKVTIENDPIDIVRRMIGVHETKFLEGKYENMYEAKNIEEKYAYQNPDSLAIGLYGVEPNTLKTLSKAYMGKEIQPEEFRLNAKLQDELVYKTLSGRQKKRNFTPDELIMSWHGGVGFNPEKEQEYLEKVKSDFKQSLNQ